MEHSLRKALRFKAFQPLVFVGNFRIIMGHFVFTLRFLQFIQHEHPFIRQDVEAEFYTFVRVNRHMGEQILVKYFAFGVAFDNSCYLFADVIGELR